VLLSSIATFLFFSVQAGNPPDYLIQLVPWLILLAIGIWAISTRNPQVRLGLVASGSTAIVVIGGFQILERLTQPAGSALVWTRAYGTCLDGCTSTYSVDWVNRLLTGDPLLLQILSWVEIISILALLLSVVGLGWQARGLLLARAKRVSFVLDTTTILVLAMIASVSLALPYGLSFCEIFYAVVVVPLLLVLVFTTRQGGVVAIGASAGWLLASLLPWAMNAIAASVGLNSTAVRVFGTDSSSPSFVSKVTPAEAFGFYPNIVDVTLAAILLIVTILWVLSPAPAPSSRRLKPVMASPTNSLSVVAFCLAFVPLAFFASLVLGHMSYDQVASSSSPQRGLGLSKMAIVFSYVNIAVVAYLIIFQFSSISGAFQ